MHQYDASNLIVHPGNSEDRGVIVEVTPELARWDLINFQVRHLGPGERWSFATTDHELALVSLSGLFNVASNRGEWHGIGGRQNPFAGLPGALYLPRRTTFDVTAETSAEFAVAWVPTDEDHEPRLVRPEDVSTEIRGGDNATRQINDILPPGFPCHRLVVVEVYTPSGSWSSYPPHKHDVHKTAPDGNVVEADLDEIYYFKLDRPDGFALQRVYTDPESPLHRAGYPIDVALVVRDNDVVLVPEGYHPVASAPGYTTYYLNVLAGSAQSLANSDDPHHAHVKDSYQRRDPRVPLYEIASQPRGEA